jgi:hypothetical protein
MVFGKTRILKGQRGSMLVSQYLSKDMYQVLKPNANTFILKVGNIIRKQKERSGILLMMKTGMVINNYIVLSHWNKQNVLREGRRNFTIPINLKPLKLKMKRKCK